jgi:hypothetical protein
MATNMFPALEPMDPSLMSDAPAIEIEIEDPESVTVGVGGMEITLEPGSESPEKFDANLAEFMDEGELQSLANDLISLVDADITSRKDWADTFVKGLEVLGMKYEERTEPWDDACGVFSPLLTEAAVRFQSEMITETFPAQGPVKTQIVGAIDKFKEEAAERVKDDMNYRLTEEMIEYRPEHERMLFSLGLAGCAFKKIYYDPSLERQVAVFIPAEDMIIPYGASNIYSAERATHVMRKTKNDIKKLQVDKFYRDIELGEPVRYHSDIEKKKAEEQGYSLTEDDRYQVLEIHVDWEMPGDEDEDGVARPYVVTIERGTNNVLAIRRNWEEDDKRKKKRQHFVQYNYIPGFGAYGMGYIHLIGGYARAGTSLIRQLVDAGTLSNLPGGLKSRGLRIKGDDTPIAPGEWRDVDIPSGSVRDNIMPLPYKEPSQVLAALLERITEEGRRLAAIADLKVSDMSAQAPVGTTLAILERQLKTMSAVQARTHASLRMEFKLLKQIIRDYMPADYPYAPEKAPRSAKQADYDLVEVIPVSDPNAATMAQRIMQYQAALQLAQGAPQIYNLPKLHRQMLEVLGIKNAEELVATPEDQKPQDPVTENMHVLMGKPIKAFAYQDHEAHMMVHQSFMQDPKIAATLGQNPMAQQLMMTLMAHIAEHAAFAYRAQVEMQLGVPLPALDDESLAPISPEDEKALAPLVAAAAQRTMVQNQAMAAQQQAQQQAMDPMVQMQQAELQLKAQELQRKEADSQRDFQIAQGKLQIEQARLALDAQKNQGEPPQMKAARAQQEMTHKEQMHQQKMRQQMQSDALKARREAQRAAQQAASRPSPKPKE